MVVDTVDDEVNVSLVNDVDEVLLVSISHLSFFKLKYLPAGQRHWNGAGARHIVFWVKYWHSLFVDELKHVWLILRASTQVVPFQYLSLRTFRGKHAINIYIMLIILMFYQSIY